MFAFGRLASGALLVQTTENEPADAGPDAPMTLTEFRAASDACSGRTFPWGKQHGCRATAFRRARPSGTAMDGSCSPTSSHRAASDLSSPVPTSATRCPADQHDLAGTFAPDLILHTSHGTTGVAEFMHTARPVFLDLADRPDLRETAQDWRHRVDIHTARTDHPSADAVLIRPDAYIAWAAATGEPPAPPNPPCAKRSPVGSARPAPMTSDSLTSGTLSTTA